MKPAQNNAVHRYMRTLIAIGALLAALPAATDEYPLPTEGGDAIGVTVTLSPSSG